MLSLQSVSLGADFELPTCFVGIATCGRQAQGLITVRLARLGDLLLELHQAVLRLPRQKAYCLFGFRVLLLEDTPGASALHVNRVL